MPRNLNYKPPAFLTDPVIRKRNFLFANYRRYLLALTITDYKILFMNAPVNTQANDAQRSKLAYYARELIKEYGRNKFMDIKDRITPGVDREAKAKVIKIVNFLKELPSGVDWEGIHNPPTKDPPMPIYTNPYEEENEQKLRQWNIDYWDKHFDELLNK